MTEHQAKINDHREGASSCARLPTVALAVLVALAGSGCAEGPDRCFPDKHCIAMPGNGMYYARWGGAVLLAMAVLFLIVLAISMMSDRGGGGCAVFIGAALMAGGAFWAYPGMISPRQLAENTAATYQHDLDAAAHAAELQKQKMATPQFQLQAARDAQRRLKERLDKTQRTRADWQAQLDKYRGELRLLIKKAGVKTHQQLLDGADTHRQTTNILGRAAELEVYIARADKLLASGQRTLDDLDQQAWRLEQNIKLNELGTPAGMADMSRIVAAATVLVDERTDAPTKEDIAAAEAKLFDRILAEQK